MPITINRRSRRKARRTMQLCHRSPLICVTSFEACNCNSPTSTCIEKVKHAEQAHEANVPHIQIFRDHLHNTRHGQSPLVRPASDLIVPPFVANISNTAGARRLAMRPLERNAPPQLTERAPLLIRQRLVGHPEPAPRHTLPSYRRHARHMSS